MGSNRPLCVHRAQSFSHTCSPPPSHAPPGLLLPWWPCPPPSRCPTTGTYPALVTAAVDAISLRHPLQIGRDAQMRGQVVWTGRTALDIRMELLQVGRGSGRACVLTPRCTLQR